MTSSGDVNRGYKSSCFTREILLDNLLLSRARSIGAPAGIRTPNQQIMSLLL